MLLSLIFLNDQLRDFFVSFFDFEFVQFAFNRGEFEARGQGQWNLGLEAADISQVCAGRSGQQLKSDGHENGLRDILSDSEIIKRPPVQHRFNHRQVIAVQTMIDCADIRAAFGHEEGEHMSIGKFPFQTFLRIVEPIPDDRRRGGVIELVNQIGFGPIDDHTALIARGLISILEIGDKYFYLTDIVRLAHFLKPIRFQPDVRQGLIGEQCIAAPAANIGDVIFEQAVNEVDIGADHFTMAADALKNVIAMMQP